MTRILIIYDTRYGSTKTIAECVAEGAVSTGCVDVVVQNVAEADPRGFDFIVIGSPIYEEHPLPSVVNFLAANSDRLSTKDVALFAVCVDYAAVPKEELVRRYVQTCKRVLQGAFEQSRCLGAISTLTSSPKRTGSSQRILLSLWGCRLRKSTSLTNRARANSEHKLLTSWSDHSL